MSKLEELVNHHLKVSKIVFKFTDISETTGKESIMYMIKSITRENHAYNVIFEAAYWSCNCPSYKYKKGTDDKGHCKHIEFVTFLLNNDVAIEEA